MRFGTFLRNIYDARFILCKKRLVILATYLLLTFLNRNDLTEECLRRILISNAVLLVIILFRPSMLLKFESITLVLFLFWVSKSADPKTGAKHECHAPSENTFFGMNIMINNLFFNLFNFYILFFILRGLFRPPQSNEENQNHGPDTTQAPITGLSQQEIEQLPIESYEILESKENQDPEGRNLADVCSICLCEFAHLEKIHVTVSCKHTFHEHCIKEWFKSQAVCPYCRANVRTAAASEENESVDAGSVSVIPPPLNNNEVPDGNPEENDANSDASSNSGSFEAVWIF